jgi:hypothetical protein
MELHEPTVDVPLKRCKLVKDLYQLPHNTTFAIGISLNSAALCPALTLTEANNSTYISTMSKTYGVDDEFWEDVTLHYDNAALNLHDARSALPKSIAIKLFLDALDTTIKESILIVPVED